MAVLVLRVLAFLSLVGIAVVTLVPIEYRPRLTEPHIEHFMAFAFVGLFFALAFPRQLVAVLVLVVVSAGLLEASQLIDPTRHARWLDLVIKVAGGLLGVAIGAGAPRKPEQRR